MVHGLAGIFGTYRIISLFVSNPPMIVHGDQETFFLTAMWGFAPVKTIFLAFPSIGLELSLIWSTAIAPFFISAIKEIE